MKIFGLNKRKEGSEKLNISRNERAWVEENFFWLAHYYGFPGDYFYQATFDKRHFPRSFQSDKLDPQKVMEDVSYYKHLDHRKIEVKIEKGLGYVELPDMPWESSENDLVSDLQIQEDGKYLILLAPNLLNRPGILLNALQFEMTKIRMLEDQLEYDTGNDSVYFVCLAEIFFGSGVILAQNLMENSYQISGEWERTSRSLSVMPANVLAYALALFCKFKQDYEPKWIDQLPVEVKKEFDLSISYLKNNGNYIDEEIFADKRLLGNYLLSLAAIDYSNHETGKAIKTLKNALSQTDDEVLKADIHNCIGYYLQGEEEYEQSIIHFKKSLAITPDYAYALDNWGYSLLMMGQLEEGLDMVKKAMRTSGNDEAYSLRNIGVYYMLKLKYNDAMHYFEQAIDLHAPVDLLHYHYARLLMSGGEREKAIRNLKIAVDNNELKARALMDEWGKAGSTGIS